MTDGTWCWQLLAAASCLVDAAAVFVLLHPYSGTRRKAVWQYMVAAALLAGVFAAETQLQIPLLLISLAYVLIASCAGFLFCREGTMGRMTLPFLAMGLRLLAGIVAAGLLQTFSGIDEFGAVEAVGGTLSSVLFILLLMAVGRFSRREWSSAPLAYRLILMAVPAASALCVLALYRLAGHAALSPDPLWFVAPAAGLLLLNLVVLFLLKAFIQYNQQLARCGIMMRQTELLKARLTENNANQEEAQRVWHDMKNHFTVIKWMVQAKSYAKLDHYLETLGGSVAAAAQPVQSGNPVLDALLAPVCAEARRSGIDMAVNVSVPPGISVEDVDLCIVFSNALDNAMEACRKLPEGRPRFISVDAYLRGDQLVAVIRNSFDGVLQRSGAEFRTTKGDDLHHGIGMGNMRRAVEKYGGHIYTNAEGSTFVLSFAMHCSVPEAGAVGAG